MLPIIDIMTGFHVDGQETSIGEDSAKHRLRHEMKSVLFYSIPLALAVLIYKYLKVRPYMFKN